MYELWKSIIIGIVEGLTEFLPVSSTGHMILVGHAIQFTGDKADTFEVVIQLGAILAIVVLYWRRFLVLFGLGDRGVASPSGQRLNLMHIFIGIVPALGTAYVLRDQIKKLFMPETVVIGLVIGGLFMIVAEKWSPRIRSEKLDDFTYKQAFFVGVAQILSLWPGFSRSGSTIAAGMLAGTSRAAAADFTFLMAVPIMCAASGYDLLKSYKNFSSDDFVFFAVGFVVSFLVALAAVATFIKLVGKLKLTYFSYYRFVLAIIVLVYMKVVGF
ncbi:undecaprenyl-diphosphate phosphatase [Paenibacillus aurantius]|uniref:Undecaprenyl-diphosphatase n=1 Tax=Paenibacillus aurantius TaxID=2918900 RepID=A0AA96LA69_9BACL|nr:undecaprenyl-diphosphate phosphatase [Paenibacillus aurantius]WNQ09984.1 undecaprenyl-diphosphate phosphatase [Paenibacillus aurantius]